MKRTIEVFRANCKLCDVTVASVQNVVGQNDRLIVYRPEDCVDGECCRKAEGYGVYAVPAIVVDRKLVHTGKINAERARVLLH